MILTTTEPGAPTGATFKADFHDPSDPDAKPPELARFVVRYPPGSVIDTTVPEQCKASDAELQAEGTAACPPGSKVGSGKIVTDTGSPAIFPRFGDNVVTQFNNDHELIGVADATNFPARSVGRSKIEGTTVTSEIPFFPGYPPGSGTAFKSMDITFPVYTRGGRAYSRTPPTCPPSGHWTIGLEFTYRDGVTQHVDSEPPCRRSGSPAPDRVAPRIHVKRTPRHRCTRRDFTARVRVIDSSRVHERVLLDHRLFDRPSAKRFRVAVPASRLSAGSHLLTIRARDAARNVARRTVAFRRCA